MTSRCAGWGDMLDFISSFHHFALSNVACAKLQFQAASPPVAMLCNICSNCCSPAGTQAVNYVRI
jgi:hypothetical protein